MELSRCCRVTSAVGGNSAGSDSGSGISDTSSPAGIPRGAEPIQVERRVVLAKSRNHLLAHALDDEEWVLWLDADVVEYPPDIIERLLATGKDIVQPHCVLDYGGPTFDCNGWRDRGRLHLDDLRAEGDLVELDAVGGTMLLVRADRHRDGLVFPAFPTASTHGIRGDRGELETEGLGHDGPRHGTSLLGHAAPGNPSRAMVMPAKPNLLYITPVIPALTGNGLAMRAGTVLEVLAARYDVHLLVAPLYAPLPSGRP